MFSSLFGSSNRKDNKSANTSDDRSVAPTIVKDEFVVIDKTEVPGISPAPLLTEHYQRQANAAVDLKPRSSSYQNFNANLENRDRCDTFPVISEDKNSSKFDSLDGETVNNLDRIPFVLSPHVRALCSSMSYQGSIRSVQWKQFEHDFTIEQNVLQNVNLWSE
ncbi:hypothetical protein TrispH2_004781 [Trichoplax sp. H2]|nr:hypothetical protein TrispH2_004781 [Trichoplax sp. H2]|eukprot:RDD42775.1 hypothetical protein TrispH2_004781 [Trichoplax sp. H2]